MANEAVDKFLASPAFRSKAHTPDLGEWLVNLTLSTAGWEGVAEQFLGELFVRNVRWILQDAPHLAHIHTGRGGGQSALMIDDSFTCTLVSRRLVMFQVYFLKNIGRPNNQSTSSSPASSSLQLKKELTNNNHYRLAGQPHDVSSDHGPPHALYEGAPARGLEGDHGRRLVGVRLRSGHRLVDALSDLHSSLTYLWLVCPQRVL